MGCTPSHQAGAQPVSQSPGAWGSRCRMMTEQYPKKVPPFVRSLGYRVISAFEAGFVGLTAPRSWMQTWAETLCDLQTIEIPGCVCGTPLFGPPSQADAPLRNPITGSAGCCARAASGHAAALPRSAMKLRRLMQHSPWRTKSTKEQRCALQQNWSANCVDGAALARTF
jgi:hypothetical protein